MARFLPILIGACFAIISGLIAAVGVVALTDYEKVAADPLEMGFAEFFQQQHDQEVCRYRLTDVQHGASVYPQPQRDDGQWENVYVCLFPQSMTQLSGTYESIIVKFEGVKSSAELSELLQDGSLEVYYWAEKQELPDDVHNRIAKSYRGMQLQDCLHCEAVTVPPSPDFGNSCVYAGIAGVSISVLGVLGFYVLRVMGVLGSKKSRRQEIEDLEDIDAPVDVYITPANPDEVSSAKYLIES